MIYAFLILLGLCAGSFVNALVWRLHEQSKSKKPKKELSIAHGRSMCPNCKHKLATTDLIPVISWLMLGGKCRYCHKPISWQYPLVEIATTILLVASYVFWPAEIATASQVIAFASFSLSLVIAMALSVYDFRWMILPDKLVQLFLVFGLIFFASSNWSNFDASSLYNLLLATFVSGGIFYILYQLSDGKWIGGGDVKLGLTLGLYIQTFAGGFMMIFLASVFGSLYSLFLVMIGKYHKKAHIPFGPFLLLATYFVVLFGTSIIDWYKQLFLI